MALWDDISKRTSETTSKAIQKAKDLSEVAKLNSMIVEEERKIDENYYKIGKQYDVVHGEDCEEEFRDIIAAVHTAKKNIIEYRAKIQEIKGVVRCEKCGAEVPMEDAFCSSCGTKIPRSAEIDNEDDRIECENCASLIEKGMRFCTNCGSPLVSSDNGTAHSMQQEQAFLKFCTNCGATLEADSAFCMECGTKV